MFIETVPNRNSPPAVLLRESYREGKRVKKRTLANLSQLPAAVIDGLRGLLKGGIVIGAGGGEDALRIERSLPHGHVGAALGMVRKIALDRLLLSTAKDETSVRWRDLIVAMIVDRLVAPRSKLGFVRAVGPGTACTSLGEVLGLGSVVEREAYEALDWLLAQQPRIESGLARRHLAGGMLVLYDVSSSYLEGRKCALARFGYSRDHRRDRPQIVYGLLCNRDGLPVAVEVFPGDTGDPATLGEQVTKLRTRFRLARVVIVGDRGMITNARIRDELKPAGFDWISCLRAPAIQQLAAEGGPLQLSLFDDRDMAEISAPAQFPGERLIVCRNPLLADERARKRGELLAATERALSRVEARVRRKRVGVRTAAEIGVAIGASRPPQDGQALQPRYSRRPPLLAPQPRQHRARGPPRRALCRPHQPAGRRHGRGRERPGLQGSGPRRARLPQPQDRRPRDPSDPALDRRSGSRPCLSLHARLSRRMASAPGAGPAAVP